MMEGKPPKPRWTPYDKAQSGIAQLRAAAQLVYIKFVIISYNMMTKINLI